MRKIPTVLAGAYALVGPKISGDPEGLDAHTLVPHGADERRARASGV